MTSSDPVSGNISVFFFVDGMLLFSELNSGPIQGPLGLSLGEADYGFTTITTFQNPYLSSRFLDGSGKELQNVNYDGSGLVVQETVYDAIGRSAIGTKATKIDAVAPNYITDFVKGFDPQSGVMTGIVAD